MTAEDDREPTSTDPNERRDAALKSAWRNASRETSSPDVDARILAAARAAATAEGKRAETPRRRTRWNAVQRWQPLLAAAAVAGLAFVLVPMTLSPPAVERTNAPVATEAADSADSAKTEEIRPLASSGATDDARASQAAASQRPARQAPPERAIAPENAPFAPRDVPASKPVVPPPPPAGEATSELMAPSGRARTEEPTSGSSGTRVFGRSGSEVAAPAGRASESAAAAAAPVPQAREKYAEDAATLDAAAWAERIDALYRAGDLAAAAQNLRAFRAVDAEADGYLADELRDWARTVE
jgi:hypothetical protein